MTVRALGPLLVAALLAGCAVGPDYGGPPRVTAEGAAFRRAGALAATAPDPAPSRWWLALNDAALTALIEEGLAASPTLQAAQARLRAARAALGESRADLAPTGAAAAAALAIHPPQSGLGQLLSQAGQSNPDIYYAGFDASWEPDLFGARRRAIEADAARAGAAGADLADSQVALAAEIARGYLALREAQQRLALAREEQALRGRVVDLMRRRQGAGVAGEGDVARAEADRQETLARIAGLSQTIDAALDQLAVLAGRAPGALDAALAAGGDLPAPPAAVAVGDPAALLRRRPDIRAAERRLAAGDAAIGQAVAQLFPTVTLRGDIGFSASDAGSLLSRSSFLALGGPSLTWDILDYPRIHARIRGARALREADAADYRRAVLAALGDAEDSLARYAHQRQALAASQARADIAARLWRLDRDRRAAGTLSEIDAAATRTRDLQARADLVQARAALTTDYVALEKSLGLGWD